MNLFSPESAARWYRIAWWLCVVTLPWLDMVNNICLILLLLLWIAEGDFLAKWKKMKSASWTFPFLGYYLILLLGLLYSQDMANGLFTLDKKITFLVLPIVAATGKELSEEFIGFLKKSFVYSCGVVVLVCTIAACFSFFGGGSDVNFDPLTTRDFETVFPDASRGWRHFSYVQLAQGAGFHPGYLSMYLVFCLVILFTADYISRGERIAHIILGLFLSCFIALLSSRIAIIAFIASSAYLFAARLREKKLSFFILTALVSVLFFLWMNPIAKFRLIEEPKGTTFQVDPTVSRWTSLSHRLLEWQGSLTSIQSHWFAGVGTGGGKAAMSSFYANYNTSTVGMRHNAHNQYLEVWMESGIIGLIVFLCCLFSGLLKLRTNPAYVSFIIIFSIMCMTESVVERQKGVVFFTLFQALFLGFVKRKK